MAVVGVTLFLMRGRGGDSTVSGGEQAVFGGVETMDPKEAYVQQLIAQGYRKRRLGLMPSSMPHISNNSESKLGLLLLSR